MEKAQTVRKSSFGTPLRILAAVIAAFVLLNLVLTYLIRIDFEQALFKGGELENAAAYVEENTDYLSRENLDRLWEVISAWGPATTYEDFDLRASIAIAREDYAKATEYMRGCITTFEGTDAERAALYIKQGCLYAMLGDSPAAILNFDEAEKYDPSNAECFLLRAQIHAQLNQAEATLRDLEKYTALAGQDVAIQASIAAIYESAGEYENAVTCYTAALESPEYYDIAQYVGRARSLMLLGDLKTAYDDLKTYFSLGGTDETGAIRAMLGICAMQKGEYDEAVEAFHIAVDAGYESPALLYSQAVLCSYVAGDYQSVVKDGEKAIALLEEEAAAQEQAAQETPEGAGQEGKNEAALEKTAQADTAELYQWVGLAYMALSDYPPAIERLDECLAQKPEMQDVRYYRAICYLAQEDYDEAIKGLSESIEREESVTESYYNRAVCYLKTEEYVGAVMDLLKVVERNDDAALTAAANELLDQLIVKDDAAEKTNEQTEQSEQNETNASSEPDQAATTLAPAN